MSRLWGDTLLIPETLARTLQRADGVTAVAERIAEPSVRRIVVSGNGAAWYAGMAMWLASLESAQLRAEILCVPAGLLARGRFRWRRGDLLFAVSSSGEFRDLVEAMATDDGPVVVAVTANAESTVARRSLVRALAFLPGGGAFTHSSAYVANVTLCLAILAAATGDAGLQAAIDRLPVLTETAIKDATEWPADDLIGGLMPRAVLAIGDGPAWVSALEMALLAREVACIPSDAAELREGTTSSMFAVRPGDLALVAAIGRDGTSTDGLEREAVTTLQRRGARVVRLPGANLEDRRLASILTFPVSVKVALHLARLNGVDPDDPATASTYFQVAR